MATTEGALLASTHRGARAINMSGGCRIEVLSEGMTRAPVVEVTSLEEAAALKKYCETHFAEIEAAFNSTTRFGRLLNLKVAVSGRKLYLRFRAFTADAMGMNMVTKGVDKALTLIQSKFPNMKVLALSGNYCTDKKPSAINWVEGRGKTVIAEAVVQKAYVEKTLKTSVDALVQLNVDKNYVGSALAGSVGGFNAQAANVVAAMFLAMGQDPAQVVESSTCLTSMSKLENGDLLIGVTMPSIEVGTVGGGTGLDAQRALLQLVGCAGSNQTTPGANARLLSQVVAAGVLSAELSLMSGLAAGHLLRAHMELNRAPGAKH
jgi:hydroxymethylglutaryl-CoA reductase (NADPH)